MSSEVVLAGVARLVKERKGHGDGAVFRLEPPLQWEGTVYGATGYDADPDEDSVIPVINQTEFVWVSAVDVPFSGPETYIFASDEDGEILDWEELPGSYRGGLNIERALVGAGYRVEGRV